MPSGVTATKQLGGQRAHLRLKEQKSEDNTPPGETHQLVDNDRVLVN